MRYLDLTLAMISEIERDHLAVIADANPKSGCGGIEAVDHCLAAAEDKGGPP